MNDGIVTAVGFHLEAFTKATKDWVRMEIEVGREKSEVEVFIAKPANWLIEAIRTIDIWNKNTQGI